MNFKRSTLILFIGAALCSCSKSSPSPEEVPEGISTYVTFSVQLPGSKLPGKALPGDYNPDGTYEGNDGVETLDIYMLSSGGTIEARRFSGSDISSNGSVVSLSQPFRTTSGNKTIYIVLNDPNPLETTITSEDDLVSTAGLARLVTENDVTYDVITMTGRTAGTVAIEPDISQQEVVSGTANQFAIEVERVASRVIVTSTAGTTITNTEGVTLGTISNMTYSVAQGTTQIYWIAQPDYVSYGYDYVPALGEYYGGQATTLYDYSDLSTPSPVPARPAAGDGYKSLPGKFLFENTHATGDRATTGYRKGNTAYVLIRGVFAPAATAIADGGSLTNGTFYVGQADGLIYSTKAAAQAAVQNQKVIVYEGGKVLYYAWLNPDDIQTPLNSPVVRNNIYHINITGFTRFGYNWNPLYPENPSSPAPNNPDPRPINPDEPESDVNPIDPLTPEQTYMTVEITALDWTVHSYNIQF